MSYAAHAQEIARRSVEEMWRDPFWEIRYGERGRAYTLEDGHHHLTWLTEAIKADEPQVFSRYSLWLRGVLTTRGMCTRHLSDHLDALARVLAELGLDDQGAARRVLDVARADLRHSQGEQGALEQVADALASEAASAICGQDTPRRFLCELDLLHHLSYLADSLSHERPELFHAHLQFVCDHPDSQRSREPLQARVEALTRGLEARGLREAVTTLKGAL